MGAILTRCAGESVETGLRPLTDASADVRKRSAVIVLPSLLLACLSVFACTLLFVFGTTVLWYWSEDIAEYVNAHAKEHSSNLEAEQIARSKISPFRS